MPSKRTRAVRFLLSPEDDAMGQATVRIPTPLRPLAGNQDAVRASGDSVRALLDDLEARHPGLRARLLDEQGGLRRFVNLFVDEEDVRHLDGLETAVRDGAVLSIVPAIAGGAEPAPTFAQLRDEVRRRVAEVDARTLEGELSARGDGGAAPVVVDVREADEVAQGRLPGAVHIPRGYLEMRIEDQVPDRDAPVVVYCAGGVRSLFAAESLGRLGYRNVRSLEGGYRGWQGAGLPVETPRALSDAERRRYSRHLLIPEVGEAGQLRLLEAKVLLIGAGGLGCPAAIYLAMAGVGTLGLVDFDVVDESNLQRQILHTTDRIGTSKVESAKAALAAANPGVKLVGFEERLTSENVERIFAGFDLVVDGSDNFATRYLVNDACVKLGIPNVHGSIYRFEGQVTVFAPTLGAPCYRCLYPEPPPPELAPSCAEAGVLGVLPGVIGLLEAVEAIKLILGEGQTLAGRLLCYDALAATFRELKLRRDPDCAYCGEGRAFPGYVDYEQFCRAPSTVAPAVAQAGAR